MQRHKYVLVGQTLKPENICCFAHLPASSQHNRLKVQEAARGQDTELPEETSFLSDMSSYPSVCEGKSRGRVCV